MILSTTNERLSFLTLTKFSFFFYQIFSLIVISLTDIVAREKPSHYLASVNIQTNMSPMYIDAYNSYLTNFSNQPIIFRFEIQMKLQKLLTAVQS